MYPEWRNVPEVHLNNVRCNRKIARSRRVIDSDDVLVIEITNAIYVIYVMKIPSSVSMNFSNSSIIVAFFVYALFVVYFICKFFALPEQLDNTKGGNILPM